MPRQGVPPPAKRLSCGRQCYGLSFRYGHDSCLIVASAPLTPLRAAVPFACSHRLGGSTSCLSHQPHKACCCHSPLRSLTGVAHANELPQLLPGCRGLTTTFRSVGQTTPPCLQRRLLAPLSVRCQVAGSTTALKLYCKNKPHPPQSVARHPPKNACGLHSAANTSSRTP